jgi:hypothetical protein
MVGGASMKATVYFLLVTAALSACDAPLESDTDGSDTSVPDTSAPDTSVPDTSVPDSFVDDTTPADTFVPDTVVADTTPADTFVPDTTPADTFVPDTTPADTTPADTTPADTTPADTTPADTTDTTDTTDTDVGPVDNGLNATWIGGACDSPSDCNKAGYTEPAVCATAGFPNGFCTQACRQGGSGAWVCPDADTSPSTDFTTTRCITAHGSPKCVAECDFDKSDTGCRPGYACVLRNRHGQPNTIFQVCLPEPVQRWPGEPAPEFDIGESCNTASDCAHKACWSLSGGYCVKTMCDVTGCPEDSTCFSFAGGESACLRDCDVNGDCRTAEGYACDSDMTCWPDQAAPTWNPAVGGTDCANAWGNAGSALHRCDNTKDDYVVINKRNRNLALCNRGTAVASFQVGLGFAPTGDKQIEGDGKTPEGVFYVAQLVPNSSFYKAFLFSYPDSADAAWGLSQGVITQAEKTSIETAQQNCTTPPQTTGLGSWVEIHGMGGDSDWTLGCAAIENGGVDQLWAVIGVRDTLVVLP